MIFDDPDIDPRVLKKMNKVMKNAATAIGGGLGLLIMQLFFDEDVEAARDMFNGLGLWLIAYGAMVIMVAFIKRSWLLKINSLLFYFVTPAVLVKLIMDATGH